MGRQREQSPIERKKESSERVLNEIEASKLSDNEFKTMVIRKLNELSENYQKLQGSYKKLTVNYTSIKKDIETINKSQKEINNTISDLKNTVEGIKSRLDEAGDQISLRTRKKKKKLPERARK